MLEATVGFLVTKGRDAAAAKLKEGDVTDERFRNMIVRELNDIKSKLDGLSRKDLLSSISLPRSRSLSRHATLLPTNGCSHSNNIPFPLFLRSNEGANHVSAN